MSTREVGQNGATGQSDLAAEVRALVEMAASLKHQVAALESAKASAQHHDFLDLRRCTLDQLLDAVQRVRGERSEAHLLDRIYRRRAARRVAAQGEGA